MMTVSSDTTIIGALRSKGRIKVDGRVEGDGEVDGMVLLSPDSYWKGSVSADIVIVEGTVDGDILARNKLEIHPNARINGRLFSPMIFIGNGARVTGDVRMKGIGTLHMLTDQSEEPIDLDITPIVTDKAGDSVGRRVANQ